MDDIRVWHITPTQSIQLERDAPTLDAVTRQLPEGYYSTFRTYDGGTLVLRLKAHLRRLFDPVSAPEVDEDRLRRELRAVLEQYRPGEARVRAVLTSQGQAYLALEPLQLLPREVYDRG
ncbi:MAG TPA: hypothetical protein VGK56_02385, partial [Anaerolineales bacterium]